MDEALPDFLSHLRLPGEADIIADIKGCETKLRDLTAKAARLERFRHLVGHFSGEPLEELVIESLNVVLKPTEFRAEDREDVGAEHFWIVGPDGDHALAESRGVEQQVRRPDVNQVENHRAELENGASVEQLPGLLVINIFRNDESLDRRQFPVSDDVVSHAVHMNVLVLRGLDLYTLVRRAMTEPDTGEEFLRCLTAGGGWLEVGGDSLDLHSGKR